MENIAVNRKRVFAPLLCLLLIFCGLRGIAEWAIGIATPMRLRHFAMSVIVATHLAQLTGQPSSRVSWQDALNQNAAWYESPQARTIADSVLLHQRTSGGWPKDVDMTVPPSGPSPDRPDATIDNSATTTQIRFLARIVTVEAGMVEAGFSRPEIPGSDPVRKSCHSRGRLPARRAVSERRVAAVLPPAQRLLAACHVQ